MASESRDEGVYAWLRKGAGQTILCVMNTQNTAHKKFPLYLSFPAGAEELLNTEAPCWGGADKSKPKALHTSDGGVYGRDYTLTVDLPAMGSRMFKLTPEAPRPEAAQASARRAAAARRKAARTQNAKADAAAYNSKSNICSRISRLLKTQRDILRSGAVCGWTSLDGFVILLDGKLCFAFSGS